ncbi:Histidine protein methyltransferase 1 [Boothiomyces sp. JEL0866]|nr:Histidine protein methyltransferase 1 [Boothiomyces sp. JEL0866]
MFSFDFGEQTELNKQETVKRETAPGFKVEFTKEQLEEKIQLVAQAVASKKSQLYRRCVTDVNFQIAQSEEMDGILAKSIQQSSDLIAGEYEGGIKTWECSLDLLEYLENNTELVKGKKVIELGCGSALPGIFCLEAGARFVSFQDYNENVIRLVTVPNVVLNTTHVQTEFDGFGCFEHEMNLECPALDRVDFYAGDWANLHFIAEKYDVILTSETIYEAESIPSLLELIKQLLAPNGAAFVAAKHNYFGCTGSIAIFKQACTEFNMEPVFIHSDGVRREIIKLTLQ